MNGVSEKSRQTLTGLIRLSAEVCKLEQCGARAWLYIPSFTTCDLWSKVQYDSDRHFLRPYHTHESLSTKYRGSHSDHDHDLDTVSAYRDIVHPSSNNGGISLFDRLKRLGLSEEEAIAKLGAYLNGAGINAVQEG